MVEDFGMVGDSAAIRKVRDSIRIARDNPKASVLILGESGVGKELVARAILGEKMTSLNCGAVGDELLQSTIFGHVRGAFTGAVNNHVGILEEEAAAAGGGVFLDEIGTISEKAQVMLLRAVEYREIRPLGASKSTRVDVRMVFATNADLKQLVYDGVFREDLYSRLRQLEVVVEPLRARGPGDVMSLVKHFAGDGLEHFAEGALVTLAGHDWRGGNIRDLKYTVERLLMHAGTKGTITEEQVRKDLKGALYPGTEEREMGAGRVATHGDMPSTRGGRPAPLPLTSIRAAEEVKVVLEEVTRLCKRGEMTLKKAHDWFRAELVGHQKGSVGEVAKTLGTSRRTVNRARKPGMGE